MKELIESTLFNLRQLKSVLCLIEPDDYGRKLSLLNDSSIGMHTRHVLEFYDLLLNSLAEVCYDDRPRRLDLESDVNVALDFLAGVIKRVSLINEDKRLTFIAGYDPESDKRTKVDSKFSRELAFNLEHCIHHMALMRVGFHEFSEKYTLPETFGVAPSTLRALHVATTSD